MSLRLTVPAGGEGGGEGGGNGGGGVTGGGEGGGVMGEKRCDPSMQPGHGIRGSVETAEPVPPFSLRQSSPMVDLVQKPSGTGGSW